MVDKEIQMFLSSFMHEYMRAMEMYPRLRSAHEAYAVILEELEEFWEETRKKPAVRNRHKMRHELVQVAAMCLRATVDLQLSIG